MPEQILRGAGPIADATGLPRRMIYTLASNGVLPVFRLGHAICAHPSTLRAWLARRTAEANRRAAR